MLLHYLFKFAANLEKNAKNTFTLSHFLNLLAYLLITYLLITLAFYSC